MKTLARMNVDFCSLTHKVAGFQTTRLGLALHQDLRKNGGLLSALAQRWARELEAAPQGKGRT